MSTLGVTSGPRTDRVIQWLLDGDPAIRWQALRDLVGAAERTIDHERRKVARDGWGGPSTRQAGPGGHLGWRAVVGRRALLAKVDLDHLYDADAP